MEDPLSREKLKEERRIRKKQKRERAKLGRDKSDKGVTIVTEELYNSYQNSTTRKQLTVNLLDYVKSHKKIEVSNDSKVANAPKRCTGKHRENAIKKSTKLKQIVEEAKSTEFITCDNKITQSLEETSELFIKRIVELQEKLYKRNAIKGDLKRRYVIGFHECKKYLIVKKIKILIIAQNINSSLQGTVKDLLDICKEHDIPYIFSLKRRQLGVLTLKYLPVSCVGVLYYDGADDLFKQVLKEMKAAKESLKLNEENCDKFETGIHENIIDILK